MNALREKIQAQKTHYEKLLEEGRTSSDVENQKYGLTPFIAINYNYLS